MLCTGLCTGQELARISSEKRARRPDQITGIIIVRRALETPARPTPANAGVVGPIMVGKRIEKDDAGSGFTAQTGPQNWPKKFGAYCARIGTGVIDPLKAHHRPDDHP